MQNSILPDTETHRDLTVKDRECWAWGTWATMQWPKGMILLAYSILLVTGGCSVFHLQYVHQYRSTHVHPMPVLVMTWMIVTCLLEILICVFCLVQLLVFALYYYYHILSRKFQYYIHYNRWRKCLAHHFLVMKIRFWSRLFYKSCECKVVDNDEMIIRLCDVMVMSCYIHRCGPY